MYRATRTAPLFPLRYRPFTARLMPFAKNLLRRPDERNIMMLCCFQYWPTAHRVVEPASLFHWQ